MTGLCRDCKWWQHPIADDDSGGEDSIRRTEEGVWGSCQRPFHQDAEGNFDSLFEPDAADTWGSVILTAPNFGCVQYEVKSEATFDV